MDSHDFNFGFNHVKHDFWEIYEVLIKYYPIGINGESLQNDYSGIKELRKIITENIHNPDKYQIWLDFIKTVNQNVRFNCIDRTMGQCPAYSAQVEIAKEYFPIVEIERNINISLSLLGKYYCIYGEDIGYMKNENGKINQAIFKYVVSPYGYFNDAFLEIEEQIKTTFPDYRIVPFRILTKSIKGLEFHLEKYSIYRALFNDFIKLGTNLEGNTNYGSKSWENKNFDKNFRNN